MTSPTKDQRFNDALKRMLDSPPKENKDIQGKSRERRGYHSPKPGRPADADRPVASDEKLKRKE